MNVLIRVDGSELIGSGHVMRCLTLANQLTCAGVKCTFAMRDSSEFLVDKVEKLGFTVINFNTDITRERHGSEIRPWLKVSQVEDCDALASSLNGLVYDWVIVDQYALDECWEQRARKFSKHTMVIDDLVNRRHDADYLLDQTLGRRAEQYKALVSDKCILSLGSTYALLRPEFEFHRISSLARRESGALSTVGISLGGAQNCDLIISFLTAIASHCSTKEFNLNIIVSEASLNLKREVSIMRDVGWTISLEIDPPDVAAILSESDVVIGAGGTSTWERCALGVPSLLFVIAENQKEIASLMVESKAAMLLSSETPFESAVHFLKELKSKPEKLRAMSLAAANICAGTGAEVVAKKILENTKLDYAESIRPVVPADLPVLLQWRNHPEIRAFLTTRHVISWKEHCRWFLRANGSEKHHILVFSDQNRAGFVQFSIESAGSCEWGFYIMPSAPKGLAMKLGTAAIEYAFSVLGVTSIKGRVDSKNLASKRFHEKLGFTESLPTRNDNSLSLYTLLLNRVV